jgi:RNA polymerase sigma factor (sigma-70 family)
MSEADETIMDSCVRSVLPLVTASLVRRYGDFAGCEDAVQEALVEALDSWPRDGRPRDVKAWLITVARRRYIDAVRSDAARRAREDRDMRFDDRVQGSEHDDSLAMVLMCCHPAVPPMSRVALTLRSVCGLTTTQIAAVFFQSETAISQRITRAKRAIDDAGRRFDGLSASEVPERVELARMALYLMFTEGYAPSEGQSPVHVELVSEAIRLTRMLHRAVPADQETAAVLAIMLINDARTASRIASDGMLVALPDQNRSLWDQAKISEGRRLSATAFTTGRLSPYIIQAAIAAEHAAADRADHTDWTQILGLYDTLITLQPGPAEQLGRAAAIGMAIGAHAGLAELAALESDERLARSHRLMSVRAGLLAQAGQVGDARAAYAEAAARTSNLAERRWLESQVDRMSIMERVEEGSR